MGMSMFQISADGTRWAAVAKTEDGKVCLVDGEPGPTYQRIRRPAFTSDNRVVYQVIGDDERVVVDHVEGPAAAGISQLAVGGSVAYLAESSKGFDVYVDGDVAGTYREAGDVTVDAAGNVAYWGSTAGMKGLDKELKNKRILFLNGEQHAVAGNLGYPELSVEGGLAYLEVGKKWQIVKDEVALGDFDWALPPKWSRDGKRLAAAVRKKDRWGLFIDGEVSGTHGRALWRSRILAMASRDSRSSEAQVLHARRAHGLCRSRAFRKEARHGRTVRTSGRRYTHGRNRNSSTGCESSRSRSRRMNQVLRDLGNNAPHDDRGPGVVW